MHTGEQFFLREANKITPVRFGKKLCDMTREEVFKLLEPFAGQKRRSILGCLFKGKRSKAQTQWPGNDEICSWFTGANFIEWNFPHREVKRVLPTEPSWNIRNNEASVETWTIEV